MKLLQKQKEGKKRMKMIGKQIFIQYDPYSTNHWFSGNVEIPQKAFYDFLDKKS